MSEEQKKELLDHYATGDVHRFLQMDGWLLPHGGDDVMRPDEDGDWLCSGITDELRKSEKNLAVRIQIHEGTKHEDAVRLLEKMLAWLQTDRFLWKYWSGVT